MTLAFVAAAVILASLEAEFFSMTTYGATLVQLGVISSEDESGPTKGGSKVPHFGSSPAALIAAYLREQEIDHVLYLRKALGSAAIKKPAINLDALGYGFASVASN